MNSLIIELVWFLIFNVQQHEKYYRPFSFYGSQMKIDLKLDKIKYFRFIFLNSSFHCKAYH